jgi:hypothetical protein
VVLRPAICVVVKLFNRDIAKSFLTSTSRCFAL